MSVWQQGVGDMLVSARARKGSRLAEPPFSVAGGTGGLTTRSHGVEEGPRAPTAEAGAFESSLSPTNGRVGQRSLVPESSIPGLDSTMSEQLQPLEAGPGSGALRSRRTSLGPRPFPADPALGQQAPPIPH